LRRSTSASVVPRALLRADHALRVAVIPDCAAHLGERGRQGLVPNDDARPDRVEQLAVRDGAIAVLGEIEENAQRRRLECKRFFVVA
jgi:hypothetical protein